MGKYFVPSYSTLRMCFSAGTISLPGANYVYSSKVERHHHHFMSIFDGRHRNGRHIGNALLLSVSTPHSLAIFLTDWLSRAVTACLGGRRCSGTTDDAF